MDLKLRGGNVAIYHIPLYLQYQKVEYTNTSPKITFHFSVLDPYSSYGSFTLDTCISYNKPTQKPQLITPQQIV